MPELPEVETVRRGLAPVMEGQRIERLVHNRADLRFPFPDRFAERLSGARITHLGRKAKFLTLALSTDEVLVMHLGMTGRFTVAGEKLGEFQHETGTNPRHDHVVFNLENGASVTYNDPRRFGFMELWPAQQFQAYPRLMAMGPEPLSNGFSEAYLNTVLRGRKTPIKSALLDQSVLAGLGNSSECAALWSAGVSPRRSAATVPGQRAARLVPAINDVIAEAIAAGGSSISDFASASGELGYFQHTFAVYDREGDPCRNCTKPIQRIVQSGRSSFFCSACQH